MVNLDMAEQVTRIERAQEETRKFVAEQHKLLAERDKMTRESQTELWKVVITALGAGAALIIAGATLAKVFLP